MPAGMIVARIWASWPAPLGMRIDRPPANVALALSMAAWIAPSITAGAPVRIHSTATLPRPRAGDFRGRAAQQMLQPGDDGGIGVANLKQHFGMARDDAGRAWIERDAARGPHRARSAGSGKPIIDLDAKPRQRQAGVPANGHPRRAGVILLAVKPDPVLPDADDRGDDADRKTGAFEGLALFDMRFQIAD